MINAGDLETVALRRVEVPQEFEVGGSKSENVGPVPPVSFGRALMSRWFPTGDGAKTGDDGSAALVSDPQMTVAMQRSKGHVCSCPKCRGIPRL